MSQIAARPIYRSAQEYRPLERAAAFLAAAARSVADRWRDRRGAVSIASLNDHVLADLGYHRASIAPLAAAERSDGEMPRLLAGVRNAG